MGASQFSPHHLQPPWFTQVSQANSSSCKRLCTSLNEAPSVTKSSALTCPACNIPVVMCSAFTSALVKELVCSCSLLNILALNCSTCKVSTSACSAVKLST